MKLFLSVFIILFLIAPVFAAVPLVTDTVYTVAPGRSEIDAGVGTTNTQTVLTNAVGLIFRHGILPHFDLAVAVPYTISDPVGLNDIYLHAKYRFWQRDDHDGLAARLDFKFSNANPYQGLGSGDNDCRLLFIYSRKIGLAHLHLNFGYVNTGINAGRVEDDYFSYSCAVEQPVFEGSGEIFAEYVGNNSLSPSPTFILLGARSPFINGTKLDIGYTFGLNDKSIKNSLTAELHCEF
ncbi:MAG: transporter [Candidatus Saganbacteria bacterium]|nr:transporter [Candidatus Saganbacteria bacterium]